MSVRAPKPCIVCRVPCERLCDGKVPGARGRLRGCNAPLCMVHATAVGPDLDLCPSCCERAEATPPAPVVKRPAPPTESPQLALPLRAGPTG